MYCESPQISFNADPVNQPSSTPPPLFAVNILAFEYRFYSSPTQSRQKVSDPSPVQPPPRPPPSPLQITPPPDDAPRFPPPTSTSTQTNLGKNINSRPPNVLVTTRSSTPTRPQRPNHMERNSRRHYTKETSAGRHMPPWRS